MKSGLRRMITVMAALAMAFFAASIWGQGLDQAMPARGGGGSIDAHAGMNMGAGGTMGQNALEKLDLYNRDKYSKQNRAGFNAAVQLDEFRRLSTQHNDQIKILDSWARQSLWTIRHRHSLNGQDALAVVLDMTLRREAWMDKKIIYVRDVPIREELGFFASGPAEAKEIREKALVSPDFLMRDVVLRRLDEISMDSRRLQSVNRVREALGTFLALGDTLHFLPPPTALRGTPWVNPADVVRLDREREAAALMASVPTSMAATATAPATAPAAKAPPPPSPYTAEQVLRINLAFGQMVSGWQDNDAELANRGLQEFATVAKAIDPEVYPSVPKRTVELWYNRTFSGTLVAFVYFAAMTLFFLAAVGVTKRTRKPALGIFAVALVCHIAAMAVRWWISGRIPIQNQFESVMASACIGCVVGLCLELWKRNGIFGTAFSFVGFLSATSLLAAPYVFGITAGAEPGKVAGILSNTVWLYIHVNITIASYALILASAAIAGIFLILRQWYWINPIEPGFETPERSADQGGSGGGGGSRAVAAPALSPAAVQLADYRKSQLDTIDQANMVVVQMAFWLLGIGVMCGAVWADQSWGRPWGWDPKETFALVTWMVYLVLVHVRLVVKHKADTTAWLSIFGCVMMLFNWIGVNFFLKGLHSYA